MVTRREFVRAIGAASGAVAFAGFADGGVDRVFAASKAAAGVPPETLAEDESFWFEVQQAFTTDRTIINLNNGGVSPSPRVVQEAMRRYLEMSNQAPSHYLWTILEPQIEPVRKRLAQHFGCDPEEMAITRNASESLEICLLGLDLVAGDEILTTTQDYPRMLTTIEQRARREGIVLKKVKVPSPPRVAADLVTPFAEGITPRTKVILVSHIVNLTGQIFPVREICRLGREKGIEVIVDGAHAFAHFPFRRDDLDCDYYGVSLHKWLFAPHGTGFLYVRRPKIEKLWPLMAAPVEMNRDIRKYEEIGTHPAANHNAIAEALTFHEGIGIERKAARLRWLRARWEDRLRGRDRVTLRTPADPAQACGIGNVHIAGLDQGLLAAHLWDKQRIIVTPIGHEEVPGIRVTPSVYTLPSEIDRFSEAMDAVLRDGIGG
jgi:selenocysteine lyase/cysteine desulfurase